MTITQERAEAVDRAGIPGLGSVTPSLWPVILDAVAVAVVVEDERRRIVLANEEFCRLFGVAAPPAALVGADCVEAAEGSKGLFADPLGSLGGIEKILRRRDPIAGEELADGRTIARDDIPVDVRGVPRGHLWVSRDVTEQ